ncbi:MAG: hypothetical protein KAR79_00935, partial [Simkaniaceae bacterium]|nr:hypothetical protein [Simkaniaceae bacterium]
MNNESAQLLILVEIFAGVCLILWIVTAHFLRVSKQKTRQYKEQLLGKNAFFEKEKSKLAEQHTQKFHELQVEKNQQIEQVQKELRDMQAFYEEESKQRAEHFEKAFQEKTKNVQEEIDQIKKMNQDLLDLFPVEMKKKEEEIKVDFQSQVDEIIANLKEELEKKLQDKDQEIEEIKNARESTELLSEKTLALENEVQRIKKEALSATARVKVDASKQRHAIEKEHKEELSGLTNTIKALEEQVKSQTKEERKEQPLREDFAQLKEEKRKLENELKSQTKQDRQELQDKEMLIQAESK